MRILIPAIVCVLIGYSAPAAGDSFDAPTGYYDSATGTIQALKDQLHDIIDDHSEFSYNNARSILQDTDVDPNDPDRLILVYNRVSLDVSNLISSPGISGWDSGASWNREHTWPRSRGVNSSGADNSDLHQLRPSTPGVNGSRSNLNFGGEFGQSFGRVTDNGATVWYPGDDDAGMIARQQFYMAVRYDGSDPNTGDLELASGNPGTSSLGDLDRLLEWHYQAVPDQFERRRNDVIFEDYQGNRNPFVDRPEFVHSVFVDNANDTQLALDGGIVNADGSSTLDVDFGRVIVGATNPTQTVTLSKSGLDGTYYNVSTSGITTSNVGGSLNAFAIGSSGSQAIELGVSSSSPFAVVPGEFTGAVTIDNLDVTTGGGVGVGANDGNDVIDVSYTVLGHSNASFASHVDTNTLFLDLGQVALLDDVFGEYMDFSVFNLEGTPGFTAGLDLDSVLSSGDVGVFDLDLEPFTGIPEDEDVEFSGLAAGDAASFRAFVNENDPVGTYSATYTFGFSDEDLLGATQVDPLTLILSVELVRGQLFSGGDFNNDGFVSQADLDLVLLNWGATVLPPEWIRTELFDGVEVSQNELDAVLLEWGFGSPPSFAVPEPSALAVAGLLSLVGLNRRRR